MREKIKEAIQTTLVVENKQSINLAVDKIMQSIDVLQIIKEWYTLGDYGDILQDERGNDLEEIIENLQNK